MAIKGVNQDSKINANIDEISTDSNSNNTPIVDFEKFSSDSLETLDIDDFVSVNTHNGIDLRKTFADNLDVSKLPYYDDHNRYRLQGFTVTDEYVYVTAYSREHDPSVILVYDKDGNYLGLLKLPSGVSRKAHVGGISYDNENNVIYLTADFGRVLVLDNEVLADYIKDYSKRSDGEDFNIDLNNDEFNSKKFVIDDSSINVIETYSRYLVNKFRNGNQIDPSELKNIRASSVYYDSVNHKLYVPVFGKEPKIFVYDVEANEDGSFSYKFNTLYGYGRNSSDKIDGVNLPISLQGVATYTDENGDTYLLLTSSYGKGDSVITKYKINSDDTIEFAGQHVLKGKIGLENLVVDEETGDIVCNFENYVGGSDQDGGEFVVLNIDDINGRADDEEYKEALKKLEEKMNKT